MDQPLPFKETEAMALPNGIDKRRLVDTGLTPRDFNPDIGRFDPDCHPADAVDPDAIEAETDLFHEIMTETTPSTDESGEQIPHPSSVHTEFPDLAEIPENVPTDAEKAEIELAQRFIRGVIREIGHHDSARRELTDWASSITRGDETAYPEPRVSDPRKAAFSIGVAEFARSQVKDAEKVSILLTWGKNEYPDVLRDVKKQFNEHLREKCEAQLEEEEKHREARLFEESPPDQIGNWEQFEPDKPDAEVAYRGVVGDVTYIIVLYETEDGDIDGHGTIQEWWVEADLARETDVNAHLVRVTRDPIDPWRDLLNHLQHRDCEPV
ncbi:hypothetical protein RH831_10645 [Halodesulfurarchaeum sp. HSR-GB]|uniref:hypothetical protein n=1 Tax=Halodesulfurarchaeum sp. HSR-GB TaxID=3074077 RepID=UPI0028653827|nr:hypothetical protein [Halodesulfurarchaeum sp. HSR-GB]MDR5657635.1 hypothetical protein [Halodesulfurarchaeum sp. HSR-GB]